MDQRPAPPAEIAPPAETAPPAERFALVNARLVLPADIVERGTILVGGGLIEAIEPESTGSVPAMDCGGDVVMPGIVDVHTDHFEKHVFPRPRVDWDPLSAALAHDAQVIGAGTTTVFDSLTVGGVEGEHWRRGVLLPMLAALQAGTARHMFKAEHLVHLRCETGDARVTELLDEALEASEVAVASVMDHTPGVRQTRDLAAHIKSRAASSGRSLDEAAAEINAVLDRVDGVAIRTRPRVIARLTPTAIPLMSHDDTTLEDIEDATRHGIDIAEFPTTLAAARTARAAGMTVVGGAPNYMRGGSQSGNVALIDLLAEGLVDILASDYVPRSILDAVFALPADAALAIDLPAAVRMATLAPAKALGLTDRGALAPCQRAALLRVGRAAKPHVKAAWRAGARVA